MFDRVAIVVDRDRDKPVTCADDQRGRTMGLMPRLRMTDARGRHHDGQQDSHIGADGASHRLR